jgi:hypothetical protein
MLSGTAGVAGALELPLGRLPAVSATVLLGGVMVTAGDSPTAGVGLLGGELITAGSSLTEGLGLASGSTCWLAAWLAPLKPVLARGAMVSHVGK